MNEVRWERMFPDQLEEAFGKCPLVYFTYGLCEPHGPQNAVGLDSLKAHAIACSAARKAGGIVAPPDFWHIHELGGYAHWGARSVGEAERKWLTAVPPWIHFKNICYHVRAADALGFHAMILLTGHYGPNWNDLKRLVEIVQPDVAARIFSLPDFEVNNPGFDGDGKSAGDHAGRVETSLLWSLEPACVDVSRLPHRDEPGPHFAMGKNAFESNRLVGERMVRDEVAGLCTIAGKLLQEYENLKPQKRLETFAQVESLWNDKVMPLLSEFRTMVPSWKAGSGADEIPRDSVWYANSKIPEI